MPTEVPATTLAASFHFAEVIGALSIPVIGMVLLGVGLITRSRSAKPPQPPMGPGPYPPPSGWSQPYSPMPQGFPPPPGPTGYPPPPVPPGYPTPWPAPPPVPPQQKKPGTGLIIAGAIIVGLSVFGAVARVAESSSSSHTPSWLPTSPTFAFPSITLPSTAAGPMLKIGDCVTNAQFASRIPNMATSDCADPRADLELASVGPPDSVCPDGHIGRESTYTALASKSLTLCFLLNQFEGRCYGPDQVGIITLTDCADHRATLRIVKRVDGSTDSSLCPPNSESFPFVKPARLYCGETLPR